MFSRSAAENVIEIDCQYFEQNGNCIGCESVLAREEGDDKMKNKIFSLTRTYLNQTHYSGLY